MCTISKSTPSNVFIRKLSKNNFTGWLGNQICKIHKKLTRNFKTCQEIPAINPSIECPIKFQRSQLWYYRSNMAPPKDEDKASHHSSCDALCQAWERAAHSASLDLAREPRIASFSTDKDVDIVFEICKADAHAAADVCQRIYSRVRTAVLAEPGLGLRRVVAIPENTIPNGTSGELDRQETRVLLRDGKLEIVYDFNPEAISKGWFGNVGKRKKEAGVQERLCCGCRNVGIGVS